MLYCSTCRCLSFFSASVWPYGVVRVDAVLKSGSAVVTLPSGRRLLIDLSYTITCNVCKKVPSAGCYSPPSCRASVALDDGL